MNDATVKTASRFPADTVAFLCVAGVVAVFFAGNSLPSFGLRMLLDGVLLAVWFTGLWGIGGLVVHRLLPEEIAASLRFSASFAMGLGMISTVTLLLGLFGKMSESAAWAMLVPGLAIGLLRGWAWLKTTRPSAPAVADRWWLLILAPPAGIALVAAFVPPGVLWGMNEPNGYDVVEYHLQVPREWYEAGKIAPLLHNVFSFFPFIVEMHFLLAMHLGGGAHAGMYVAQLMHATMVVMSVVATCGIAQSCSRPGWLAAVACGSAPWLMLLAPMAYNEGGLLLFGALAIGLILPRDVPKRSIVLAGILAGFACGAKLTAVPFVVVFPVIARLLLSSSNLQTCLRSLGQSTVFVAVALAVLSPWLIRNIAWAGNPVFPEATALLGQAHFSDDQVQRWRRAHSPGLEELGLPQRARAMVEQVCTDFRFAYALLPLAIVALVLRRTHENAIILILLLLMLLFWLFFTHLQGRFLVLAIPLAAVALSGLPKPRIVAAVLCLCVIVCWMQWQAQYYRSDNELAGSMERAARQKIFALPVLDFLKPIDLTAIEPDRTVILIGDAAPFWFSAIPMNRLRYRTVFDVDARNRDAVTAWCDWPEAPPADAVMVVDPSELERFSRTYWKIPAPDAQILHRREPFILSR